MPVQSGPTCLTSESCPEALFPQTPAVCACTTATGGVNDLYFIPCSETMSEVNITDLDWWAGLLTDPKLRRIGIGLGSIGKKAQKTERIGSSRVEQITNITWALKYIIKCFDKTSADTTTEQMNALLTGFNKFALIARMSDGDDTILPIGVFTTSDFDWVVPDNFEENQSISLELSWNELAKPKTYSVAGLSAVLPKAA